jgi:hypothetical protein
MRRSRVGIALGFLGMTSWIDGALAQSPVQAQPSAPSSSSAGPGAAAAEPNAIPGVASGASDTPTTSAAPSETPQSAGEASIAPPTQASTPAPTVEQAPSTDTPEVSAASSDTTTDEHQAPSESLGGSGNDTLGDDEPQVKKKPDVEVGLRVIGGFRYRKRTLEDDATYGFQARQARGSLKLRLGKRLYTRLSAEFTDGIGSGSGVRFLRTAVLEYRHSKALRLTVGRFKRPFSYLQLQSTADLPVLDRGLTNQLIVEDSAWGDRGIGAMASGKLKSAKLGWALALTNAAPDTLTTQGVDAIARLTWSPVEMFTIGVNGGNKYLDFDEGRKHFQAIGGDVALKVAGLEVQVEGAVADRPWQASVAFGVTSLISYTQRLSKNWQLQPVVFAEYADANAEYGRNESVRFIGGINAIVREQLRIMPQYKLTNSLGEPLLSAPGSSPEFNAINPWNEGYELSLMISLAL